MDNVAIIKNFSVNNRMIAKIVLFIDILLHPFLLFKKAFDKFEGVLKILIKMLF